MTMQVQVRLVDAPRPPELPQPADAEGVWSNLSDLFVAHALDHTGAVAVRITALGKDARTLESLDPIGPQAAQQPLRRDARAGVLALVLAASGVGRLR